MAGVALIDEDSWSRADSILHFEHDGYTEVDWDSETTITRSGSKVFVDEDGAEWTEDQIVLEEEEEENT